MVIERSIQPWLLMPSLWVVDTEVVRVRQLGAKIEGNK